MHFSTLQWYTYMYYTLFVEEKNIEYLKGMRDLFPTKPINISRRLRSYIFIISI